MHTRECYVCKRDDQKKKKTPIVISTPDKVIQCKHGYVTGTVPGKIIEIKANINLDREIDVPIRFITYILQLVGGVGYCVNAYCEENDIVGYA